MEYFNRYLCAGDPSILGLFDFSYAPKLIFYAYIPVVILSLILGSLVYFKERTSTGKMLLFGVIIYSLTLFNEIAQWVTVNARINHFEWQLAGLLQVLIYIFFFQFAFLFVYKRDLPFYLKAVLLSSLTPILIALPTKYNMESFDLVNCQSNNGLVWNYIYVLEIILIVLIPVICFERFFKNDLDKDFKKQATIIAVGTVLLLGVFTIVNVFGDSTFLYQIDLIGPVGMLAFLGLVTFMIVKFKTFHIRLFGAQALVAALITLIGSKLFTAEAGVSRTITIVTLGFVSLFGYFLIRSVKKEIQTREKIEALADQLEHANERLHILDQQKSQFVSIASHQLRAPLTAIKGYLSMIMEGDYGPVEGELREMVQRVFDSANNLVVIVGDFLDVSRIEQGRMTYDWKDFDLKPLVETVGHELQPVAEKKGLEFSVNIQEGVGYMVHGDMGKLKQVFTNLVDNSIKYTPKGKVWIELSRPTPETVRFEVNDNGIGIDPGTLPKLFEKFTRAEGANDVNVIGTGLGLYVAKEMIKAHQGGRIWAESDGKGLGSTFVVELKGL